MGNTPRNAALTIGKTSEFVNRQSLLTLPLYMNRLIMQKVSWFPRARELIFIQNSSPTRSLHSIIPLPRSLLNRLTDNYESCCSRRGDWKRG